MTQWFVLGAFALALALLVWRVFWRAPDEHQGWHNQGDGWPGPP